MALVLEAESREIVSDNWGWGICWAPQHHKSNSLEYSRPFDIVFTRLPDGSYKTDSTL